MQEFIRFALIGLGIGATYSLVAQGLVLIYRGSGVLNFAHGAIGVVGAYFAWQIEQSGGSFAIAFIVGVSASATLGAITHALVMRPLRRASGLSRIVGTLGVLITVQAAVILKWGTNLIVVHSSLPTTVLHLGGSVVVSEDRLLLCAIAVVLTVTLWLAYSRTQFGLATSAVAENQRAAASIGISSEVVATANWALGSALAGAAAILVSPIVGLQASLITNLVIAAMAAALVANFSSFPIALAAAMAIGIIQTELTLYWSSQPAASSAVPFLVIVAYLVLTGRGLPLRDYFMQRLPSVGTGRIRPYLLSLGVGIGIVLVETTSVTWSDAFIVTFSTAIVLLSIVVVTGYAGQISLAQYAIAGMGALFAGQLDATAHLSFLLSVILGILCTVPVGILVALPAVRTRGINLAVVTLGLGTAIELVVFGNPSWTGGIFGTTVSTPSIFGWSIDPINHARRYALVCLIALVLATFLVANMRRGRSGRRLISVRSNERAAAALGINVAGAKLYAFALAAAIAALGGILIAFQYQTIEYSQTFTNFTSITDVGLTFLGGIGYLFGPFLGSTFAPGSVGTAISNALFSQLTEWIALVGGLAVIFMVIQNQDGVAKEIIGQLRAISQMSRRALRSKDRNPKDISRSVGVSAPMTSGVTPMSLDIRNLSVSYGVNKALDDLSVSIRPGKIVGLIGPNGAGKTTAIDAITGFTKTSSGSLTLEGRDIDKWSVSRRSRAGVSRSFQSLELFEDSTVLENIRVASDPRDLRSYVTDLFWPRNPPLSEAVLATIDAFDLRPHLNDLVEEMPYGKRRLLAVARAVATQPSVLLLDEPAAGLSDHESEELALLVRRLADEWGLAILLVEHDMNFVMSISDEIVVLDFGKTIACGAPEVVRNDLAVVEAYLGEPGDETRDISEDGHEIEGKFIVQACDAVRTESLNIFASDAMTNQVVSVERKYQV